MSTAQRFDDEDPEVRADLALRARTEATRAAADLPDWRRPEIVGAWKCRTCGELVPITEQALEHAAMWNRVLRKRGEAPLDNDRIMFCDTCRLLHRDKAADRRREQVDRIAEEVRRLKAADDPSLERECIKTLRDLGHPDVDGLLGSLTERTKPRRQRGKVQL